MSKDLGVPASPSGSRPSGRTSCGVSSLRAAILNAVVPVWAYNEEQASRSYAALDRSRPAERDYARRLFHASFQRLG